MLKNLLTLLALVGGRTKDIRPSRAIRRLLDVEQLEDRCVPAGYGYYYPYGLESVGQSSTIKNDNLTTPVSSEHRVFPGGATMDIKVTHQTYSDSVENITYLADDVGGKGILRETSREGQDSTITQITVTQPDGSAVATWYTAYTREATSRMDGSYQVQVGNDHDVEFKNTLVKGSYTSTSYWGGANAGKNQWTTDEYRSAVSSTADNFIGISYITSDNFFGSATSSRKVSGSSRSFSNDTYNSNDSEVVSGSFWTSSNSGVWNRDGTYALNYGQTIDDFSTKTDSRYCRFVNGLSISSGQTQSHNKVVVASLQENLDSQKNLARTDVVQNMDWSGVRTWRNTGTNRPNGFSNYNYTFQSSDSSVFNVRTLNQDALKTETVGIAIFQFDGSRYTLDSGTIPNSGGTVINPVSQAKNTVNRGTPKITFSGPLTVDALSTMLNALQPDHQYDLYNDPSNEIYQIGAPEGKG